MIFDGIGTGVQKLDNELAQKLTDFCYSIRSFAIIGSVFYHLFYN